MKIWINTHYFISLLLSVHSIILMVSLQLCRNADGYLKIILNLQVRVLRDGAQKEISTFDLLVGDVVVVETGDILAADGLLYQGTDIRFGPLLLP